MNVKYILIWCKSRSNIIKVVILRNGLFVCVDST